MIIPKIVKKNNINLKLTIGVLGKGVAKLTERDLFFGIKRAYIFYDNCWYKTRFKTVEELENYLKATPTYSKDQLFELVYNIIFNF